jgi:hypothetical protein
MYFFTSDPCVETFLLHIYIIIFYIIILSKVLRGSRGLGREGSMSDHQKESSVVFLRCIYLCIHSCYRFPPFLTKSASDSVVLTHLNNLFGSKPISSLEKKLPKLFVIFSSVHASHHSLKPGLSSITTAIPGAFPFPFFFFSSLFVNMSLLFSHFTFLLTLSTSFALYPLDSELCNSAAPEWSYRSYRRKHGDPGLLPCSRGRHLHARHGGHRRPQLRVTR